VTRRSDRVHLPTREIGLLAAGALAMLSACVAQTAPNDASIALFANPEFVPAFGGTSVISALVIESGTGTAVPDNTVVQFFTTLGRIDREGRTRDGIARVNFVSDSRSGLASITAVSGATSLVVPDLITVGNSNVAGIVLRADPPRITISRSTHVIARVLDVNGNPVANVPVTFRVTDDPATEFFDQQGPVFTNQNGEAENVMRTRRAGPGTAEVTAEAPGAEAALVVSEPLLIPIVP
jgi:Big-like domain-containing protein